MSAKLEQKLAEMLNMDEKTAGNALQELVSEIKRRASEGENVAVPRLGVFRMDDGDLLFEADPELESYVNAEFAGLSDVPVSHETAERLQRMLAAAAAPGQPVEPGDKTDEQGPVDQVRSVEDVDDEGPLDDMEWTEKIDSEHAEKLLGKDHVEDADFEVMDTPGREAEELAVLEALGGAASPDQKTEEENSAANVPEEGVAEEDEESLAPIEQDNDEEESDEEDLPALSEEEDDIEILGQVDNLKRSGRMKGIYLDAMRERRESRKALHQKKSRRRIAWFAIPIFLIVAMGSWYVIGLLSGASDDGGPPVGRVEETGDDGGPAASALVPPDSVETTGAGAVGADSAEVTTPLEDQPESDPPASGSAIPASDGNYAWIVGSSPSRSSAEQVLNRYTDAGAPGELVEARVDDRTVYRVAIGRYTSVEEANAGRNALPSFAPEDMWIRNIGPPD